MNLTELAEFYTTDKGDSPGVFGHSHGYTHIYETFFSPQKEMPVNLLEIGVWTGASLRMWEKYFPNAKIVGVDINPECKIHATHRCIVEIGDATDKHFLQSVIDKYFPEGIDIIIDDGSHLCSHQIKSFFILFPFLRENGLYFVEDLSVSQLSPSSTDTQFTDFLDFANYLSEQLIYFKNVSDIYSTITDVRQFYQHNMKVPQLSYFNKHLHSVQMFHNLCLLVKKKRNLNYATFTDDRMLEIDEIWKEAKGKQFMINEQRTEIELHKNELAKMRNTLCYKIKTLLQQR